MHSTREEAPKGVTELEERGEGERIDKRVNAIASGPDEGRIRKRGVRPED